MKPFSDLRLWQIDLIGTAVCAVLGLLWYAAGLQPLAQAKAARQTMLSEAAERENKVAHVEAVRAAAERSLEQLKAQLGASAVHLLPLDQGTLRLSQLSALAAEHRLTLDEVKPGSPTPGPRFTAMPMILVGSGSAPDLIRFLHTLRSRFPDIGLSSFDLRAEPENPDRPAHFAFNCVWYAAPAPAAVRK